MAILKPLGIAALLIAAVGGGYYSYVNLLHPEAVTTSIAIQAPVSEAVYGTGDEGMVVGHLLSLRPAPLIFILT